MAQKSTKNSSQTTQVKTTRGNEQQELPPELQEEKGTSFARVMVNIVRGFSLVAITLLAFRFFLLLFGASTSSSFVRFMYRSSDVVMAPFRGIFPVQQIEDSVHYLDFSALFAIVAYALLAYWMSRIIKRWERKDKIEEWKAQQQIAQSMVTTTTTTKKTQPRQ